jgi:DNA/RNA-binding domain of Phe-tRNA-synthetase-like protein
LGIGLALNIENRGNVDELVRGAVDEARNRHTLESLRDDPVIRAYRDFYWRLGIDPTKQRPAQEALLRRILRGEDMPRINPAVDIGNAVSIRYLVPVGLYDLDKAGWSDLVIRYAEPGEEFMPIGSGARKLDPSQVVLATTSGLVLHVYPHRDSELTKVDEGTRNIIITTAGVPGVGDETILESTRELIQLITKYLGGEPSEAKLLVYSIEI